MTPGKLLEGVIVPILTPFNQEGEVEEAAIERLVAYLVAAGVHCLNPCGTTGEGMLLSTAERERVAECVLRAAGSLPVLVQTGAATTSETVHLTRHARKIGAAGATVVTPYYYRYGEDALVAHFVTIAQSVPDFPIVLYNIPQLAGNELNRSTIQRIIDRCPNVIGVKDSSGNLLRTIELLQLESSNFQTVIGSDGLILPGFISGARAVISGNANVFPELFLALYDFFRIGDWQAAAKVQQKIHAVRRILNDGADISLFKAVLACRGVDVGFVRSPMRSATSAEVAACIEQLEALDLLRPTIPSLHNEGVAADA